MQIPNGMESLSGIFSWDLSFEGPLCQIIINAYCPKKNVSRIHKHCFPVEYISVRWWYPNLPLVLGSFAFVFDLITLMRYNPRTPGHFPTQSQTLNDEWSYHGSCDILWSCTYIIHSIHPHVCIPWHLMDLYSSKCQEGGTCNPLALPLVGRTSTSSSQRGPPRIVRTGSLKTRACSDKSIQSTWAT